MQADPGLKAPPGFKVLIAEKDSCAFNLNLALKAPPGIKSLKAGATEPGVAALVRARRVGAACVIAGGTRVVLCGATSTMGSGSGAGEGPPRAGAAERRDDVTHKRSKAVGLSLSRDEKHETFLFIFLDCHYLVLHDRYRIQTNTVENVNTA